MTKERFIEDLLDHKWTEGGRGEDKDGKSYVFYSLGNSFVFILDDTYVSDALYGGEWKIPMEEIRVTRHRYQSFIIETKDGDDYGFVLDDGEIEVGCQG